MARFADAKKTQKTQKKPHEGKYLTDCGKESFPTGGSPTERPFEKGEKPDQIKSIMEKKN